MSLIIENILLVGFFFFLLSVIVGKIFYKFGVFILLFFFFIGMLVGLDGIGGIYFDDFKLV